MLALGIHHKEEEEEEQSLSLQPISSKARKLLASAPSLSRNSRTASLSNASDRESLDIMVDGASGLPKCYAGKKVSVRVALVNPAVSCFTWWEFATSEALKVNESGNIEWKIDFSFEASSMGAEVIVRVVEEKTDCIVAEARIEAFKILTTTKTSTMTLAVPLGPPVWDVSEIKRNGGVLSDVDVEKQGGKRVEEPRGCCHVQLSYSADQTKGMLGLLGLVATPMPLRLQTGDVMLFNQSTKAAKITKFFTWSKWSHAAVVVKRKSGSLSVLEATGDGVELYDLDTGKRCKVIGLVLLILLISLVEVSSQS